MKKKGTGFLHHKVISGAAHFCQLTDLLVPLWSLLEMKHIYEYKNFQTFAFRNSPNLPGFFPKRILTNIAGIASFILQLWTTLPVWVVPSGHIGWIST